MKRLFIHLVIQDGEREHDYKVIHTTNCNNLDFAADWYVAHFCGRGERQYNDEWWFFWGGEIAGKLIKYQELTDDEYKILSKYL